MKRLRIYNVWRAVALALAMWAMTATGAFGVDLALSPSDILVERGEQFTMDVTVANVVNLKAVQVVLNYDSKVVRVTGIDLSDGELFWCGENNAIPGGIHADIRKPGTVIFWFIRDEDTKSTVEPGVLASIGFEVLANAAPGLKPGEFFVSTVVFIKNETTPTMGTAFSDVNDDPNKVFPPLNEINIAPSQIRIALDIPVVGYLEAIQQEDIPSVEFEEDTYDYSIDLDDYVFDPFHEDAEIAWTYDVDPADVLDIVIDSDHKVRISTLEEHWNSDIGGVVTVIFTGTCPGRLGPGASDTGEITVTVTPVNDPPEVAPIARVVFNEDESASLNLDDYVTDVDNPDEDVVWGAQSSEPNITVTIDDATRTATIEAAENWNGHGVITFTVTDPGGLQDSGDAEVSVTPVNDPPLVSDIPAFVFNEDESATANLDQYVSDVDNIPAEMRWAAVASVADIQVSISSGRVATVSASPDWNGTGTVTFTATDPGDLSGEYEASVIVSAVNDAPVVSDIPDQTIDEGGSFATISLDDYVDDVDNTDQEMTWTSSGNVALTVTITDRVARIAAPDENWFGEEIITFTARDPGGLSDSDAATFTVHAVNDAPVVSDIPDQTIDEGGSFTAISLDDYVDDVDHTDAEMDWTFSGNAELTVTITDRVATIAAPDENWSGEETITFTATDPGGLSDSDVATFTVHAVNDAPVVSDIPDQTIDEGGSFTAILLDDYVDDVDHTDEEMDWTFSGNVELTVTITDRVATIETPSADWDGEETITFTATDPGGLSGSDAATFTARGINDPPVVSDIPDQTIDEGGSFAGIPLDDYVDDLDNADEEIDWTVSGNVELTVTVTDRVATIEAPSSDWFGEEAITFTATDPAGLSDSDAATFTVRAVNDPPVVSDIPDQIIGKGASFMPIALDDYVDDADHTDEEIDWTFSGNVALTVTITDRVATIEAPSADWVGAETITFTATDPGGLSDSDAATFMAMEGVPVISGMPESISFRTNASYELRLDDYVEDPDNTDAQLTWSWVASVEDLTVDIDADRVATVTNATPDWVGTGTITFTVTDPDGLKASAVVNVTVGSQEGPEIYSLPSISFNEDESDDSLDLDQYVDDPDNTPDELSWSYESSDPNVLISIDGATHVVTFTATPDWHGSATVVFTVQDPGGLEDSEDLVVTVNPVNDPPDPFDLVNPGDGEELDWQNLRPTFEWNAALDRDGDTVSYILYYGTRSDFSGATEQSMSGTSFTPTVDLEREVTYHWRVKALDGNGGETWSAQTQTFSIQRKPSEVQFTIALLRHPMHKLLPRHIMNICVIADMALQALPTVQVDDVAYPVQVIDAEKRVYYTEYSVTGAGTITVTVSGVPVDGLPGETTQQFTIQ